MSSTKFATKMAAEVVGHGTEDGVTVGPMIDAKQRDKLAELVDDATSRGASVVTGGSTTGEAGYFFEPTVPTDFSPEADLGREEIFGPVAPITTVSDDEKAVQMANDTEYSLVAYAFTTDLRPDDPGQRGPGLRDRRHQPVHRVEPGRAVRRRQAVRLRPRGRAGGHRGVRFGQVRRHPALMDLAPGRSPRALPWLDEFGTSERASRPTGEESRDPRRVVASGG
jgi:hypothetical protein